MPEREGGIGRKWDKKKISKLLCTFCDMCGRKEIHCLGERELSALRKLVAVEKGKVAMNMHS